MNVRFAEPDGPCGVVEVAKGLIHISALIH